MKKLLEMISESIIHLNKFKEPLKNKYVRQRQKEILVPEKNIIKRNTFYFKVPYTTIKNTRTRHSKTILNQETNTKTFKSKIF